MRSNMSVSPECLDAPDVRSRSPHHKRYNGHRSPSHHRKPHYGDCEMDKEHARREADMQREHKASRTKSKSRDRDRERDRHHRDRDGHKSRRRKSHGGSRWERKSDDRKSRDRERDRDRDRSYRDNDRDSADSGERSPNGLAIGASGSEIIGYKSQPPYNTIMLRGLAQHITENDIRQDIIQCGLMPKDIRLIRKKDTGTSRGFAFVEFTTLAEATRWMDLKQGILMLQDQYRAIMQYSIPNSEKPLSHKASSDWFCIKCGALNFKRRDTCFKCHASRLESEEGGGGSDEICLYVTKTIMLRNLDALTTEDSVMQTLTTVIPDIVKEISAVCIGRDPLTSTSRGICYLGTESTVDALALHGAIANLPTPLTIDGKAVIISYCKYHMGDTKKAHEEALSSAFPNASQPSMYTLSDVDSLAEYSATRYAKSVGEYQQYFEYYKNYFTQQINAGNSITLHRDNQMDAANAAAAVAQSAILQLQANKTFYDSAHLVLPTGTDGKRYPVPDIAKFTYDKSSGYYYDPATGLYYDPNSTYYWNNVTQSYLYFDVDKCTYVLTSALYECATDAQPATEESGDATEPEVKKPKVEKHDKVKVAKKIAKDMARWAKTLNQKKEAYTGRLNNEVNANSVDTGGGAADIGYSVLEKKNGTSILGPLVAAYGESDSEEEELIDEAECLDFTKFICNLCKRQLTSAEALTKHAKLSDLHKKNLEALKLNAKKSAEEGGGGGGGPVTYRDRAKERRMKYGIPEGVPVSKLKEKHFKARELAGSTPPPNASMAASAAEPIGAENLGNRLLQKMGWSEGQGLGKTNQGRTSIIQTEQRISSVGLGNKAAYGAVAGESYKDCVKKMMFARYQELSDNENP